MIINIFMGSGAEKKAGSGEVHCVAGTVPQSGVRRHFIRKIISHRIPLITAFECSFGSPEC